MVTQLTSTQAGYEQNQRTSWERGGKVGGDQVLHFVALVSCYIGGGLSLTQQSRTVKHSRPGPGPRRQGAVAQSGRSGPSP